MSRYNIDDVEIREDDLSFDKVNRRVFDRDVDQARQSPIRRKDKMRSVEGMKSKGKRNHRKIQRRIKYEWEED